MCIFKSKYENQHFVFFLVFDVKINVYVFVNKAIDRLLPLRMYRYN